MPLFCCRVEEWRHASDEFFPVTTLASFVLAGCCRHARRQKRNRNQRSKRIPKKRAQARIVPCDGGQRIVVHAFASFWITIVRRQKKHAARQQKTQKKRSILFFLSNLLLPHKEKGAFHSISIFLFAYNPDDASSRP